jgi:hypothetical protein
VIVEFALCSDVGNRVAGCLGERRYVARKLDLFESGQVTKLPMLRLGASARKGLGSKSPRHALSHTRLVVT